MVDTLNPITEVPDAEMDFLTLLEESFALEQPERGDIVTGTILSIDSMGMLVDIGMKRDGVVSRTDLDRVGNDAEYHVGDSIAVMLLRSEDDDGNMIVSVAQAKQNEDWVRAEELMKSEEVIESVVADANRGGLIVPYGNLRGFVPASHVLNLPRGLTEEERTDHLVRMVGNPVAVKVIEVNRRRRRLVMSQREAQRERRDALKDELLSNLTEGEIRHGVVSGLRDFGAFVDLGGADGLIHISELAWHRVKHPREVLTVGQEVDVYVLRLDQDGRRIGLSLKRLQPNPWSQVDELYHIGQLVEGTVSRVTQFGAFVSLDPGIEALLHASQMVEGAPIDPTTLLHEGQVISARIISIEPHRQRLGLSIRDVDNGLELPEVESALDDAVGDVDNGLELPEVESALDDAVGDVVVGAVDEAEIETGASEPDTVEFPDVGPVAEDEAQED